MNKNKLMTEIVALAGFDSVEAFKTHINNKGYREEYWMGGIVDALKVIENYEEEKESMFSGRLRKLHCPWRRRFFMRQGREECSDNPEL